MPRLLLMTTVFVGNELSYDLGWPDNSCLHFWCLVEGMPADNTKPQAKSVIFTVDKDTEIFCITSVFCHIF